MWNNRSARSLLMGVQNDTGTLGDSLAVSLKNKQTNEKTRLPYNPAINLTPWYLFTWPKLGGNQDVLQ